MTTSCKASGSQWTEQAAVRDRAAEDQDLGPDLAQEVGVTAETVRTAIATVPATETGTDRSADLRRETSATFVRISATGLTTALRVTAAVSGAEGASFVRSPATSPRTARRPERTTAGQVLPPARGAEVAPGQAAPSPDRTNQLEKRPGTDPWAETVVPETKTAPGPASLVKVGRFV